MVKIFLIIYNLFLLIFLVPILLGIVLSGKRNRKDFFYCIKERLACYDMPQLDKNKKTVWIHCASLGEARAVEPMMDKLQEYNVVITAITKSAREYISKLKSVDFYALAPVDIYPFVAKVIKKIKPDMLLLIETEFWPSLLYCANKSNVKIVTVNGRLSKSAFPYYKLSSFFWRKFLNLISHILVRNEQDYERFIKITGSSEKIKITGNIKYDRDWTNEKTNRESLGYRNDDLILIAGSTRKDEEKILLNAFEKLKNKYNNLKLIIAPRHISRVNEIVNIIQEKKLEYSLFSTINKNNNKNVLMLDVFGKLQMLYSVSDIVFIGGSIIKKGGQNPIEPSAYAKPTIFGKYMYNFDTESKLLKDAGASFEVSDENDLQVKIDQLLADKQLRISMGQKSLKVVENQTGAINKNIGIIKKYIDE
ncbi:MAG: glycosyltransferase N-terminal domain-containing protein [Endomicrobiaceae bacterium]|nr:glycosyltransferase N-terminal domain-containing protein [Endomicrobiaceae bacterium]